MVPRKKRFLVGGLVLFIALGFLGYTGFAKAAIPYYTVSELFEKGSSIYGETIRVNGEVLPGSVQQEMSSRTLEFTVIDVESNQSLPVFYQGVVPDTFQAGYEVVVEGHLNSEGVFQAQILMPKCPSRYLPEEE